MDAQPSTSSHADQIKFSPGMEALLSIYESDDSSGASRDSDDEADDALSKKRRPRSASADSQGGGGTRKRRLTIAGPGAGAGGVAPAALPSLDADFFSVSPNHVYTTVLTNGQRALPSAAAAAAADHGWARAVPHIEGNWATHIYIRVPNTDEVLQLARGCIAEGQGRLGASLQADGKEEGEGEGESEEEHGEDSSAPIIVPGDLRPQDSGGAQHLSLSRTVYLRSHHIDPFVADLRKALEWATSFTVGLDSRFGLLVNDERTRSFLTVGVGAGCVDRLRRLVASVDSVLARYRQPVYYADPKLHVSVASLKGDAAAAWEEAGARERRRDKRDEGEQVELPPAAVVVDMIECRVGHKLFEVPLREL